jgi:hypothetical protein
MLTGIGCAFEDQAPPQPSKTCIYTGSIQEKFQRECGKYNGDLFVFSVGFSQSEYYYYMGSRLIMAKHHKYDVPFLHFIGSSMDYFVE